MTGDPPNAVIDDVDALVCGPIKQVGLATLRIWV
jgi:hypothetical protein